MKLSDSEPPCILGLEVEGNSFYIQNIDPANVSPSNRTVPTIPGFLQPNSKISIPSKTTNCFNILSPTHPTIYDSTESTNSPRRPWRLSEMNGMSDICIETSHGYDEDDSCGPPVLSPQIELVEDNQMMETVDNISDKEAVEFEWAQHSENNVESLHCNQVTRFVTPKGKRIHKRNQSELVSILQKPARRANFSYAQYEALFATWEVTQVPHKSEVHELVHITGLSLSQVKNWFRNRRRLTRRYEARERLRQVPFEGQRRPSDLSTSTSHSSTTNDSNRVRSLASDTGSSRSPSTRLVALPQKLNENETRERRMEAIKRVSVSALEECMENNRARLSQLVLMYMKKKLDMRRTLLRETTKLKERTAIISPFSHSQLNAMRKWRDDFFCEIGDELNEDKRRKLSYVKANVIEVWQPLITYGKLTKASLEIAIDDFSRLNGVDSISIADTDELTVPGILRYMENHF